MRGSPPQRVFKESGRSSWQSSPWVPQLYRYLHLLLVPLALPFCELQVPAHDWSCGQHLPQMQHLELWVLHWTPWPDLTLRTSKQFCLVIPVSDHSKTVLSVFLSFPSCAEPTSGGTSGAEGGFPEGPCPALSSPVVCG